MMNQPTRQEFDQLAKRVARIEQRTEEIKAVRVEVASEDVVNRLKGLEEGQEELKEDTAVLKIQMQGARADILQIRESQADLRDRLIEHSEDLKAIKDKQDAHSELLGQIITIGESHTESFDEIKATQDVHSRKLDEQAAILQEILNRIPPRNIS